MGGVLESWDVFADASNAISKPSDVASHWREVGELLIYVPTKYFI